MTKEQFAKNTAKWLQTNRRRLGLTQSDLAALAGVSDASISNWEKGCGVMSAFSKRELRRVFRERPMQGKIPLGGGGVTAS